MLIRRHALGGLFAATLVAAVSLVAPANGATLAARATHSTCAEGAGKPTWIAVIACSHPTAKSPQLEADLFVRLNQERAARHLRPLVWDTRLAGSARAWSQVMSTSSMHHSDITKLYQGRFDEVAENIAWASGPGATSGAVHLMWMKSDHHRENMLAPHLTNVGIGVYCANGVMWATQQFGQLTSSGPAVAIHPAALNPIVRPDPGRTTC